jgi:hypothetical protein
VALLKGVQKDVTLAKVAHKKENRPIKQGLKKTQKAGSSPQKEGS